MLLRRQLRNYQLKLNLFRNNRVKTSKLRELKKQELIDRLTLKNKELSDARYDKMTGKLTDLKQIGKLRREIARIETIIREESFVK